MGQKLVHGPDPGPLHLIDGLDLDTLAFRLVLVKLLDVFILQELGRLLRGNGGLGPGGDFPGALFRFRPFGLFLGCSATRFLRNADKINEKK